VDVLRVSLAPLASQIEAAFVFGSVAKNKDTAKSDIDLLVVTQHLTYRELFSALEPATSRLGRVVNPTVYSRNEFEKRVREGNAFVKRVIAQPRVWIIGGDSDLTT
jgi:predicted nucleotidyltransferase